MTGRVIFSKECLPTLNDILDLSMHCIHCCIKHHHYHSTRARFCFGILTNILSKAYGVETSLKWLEEHREISFIVCSKFKKMLSEECPDKDQPATFLQEMRNVMISELREFIQMLETIQESLKSSTMRVHKRDITLQELQLLQCHCDTYNNVAGLVSASDAVLQGDILNSIETEYKDIKQKLSDLFIRVVPSHKCEGW